MMYGRAEAIWKDIKKPYGIGIDLATVRKRNTFGNFSMLNDNYSTVIGTLYYDFPKDWSVKLDAGKYLAGDEERHFHYQEPLTMAGKLVLLQP